MAPEMAPPRAPSLATSTVRLQGGRGCSIWGMGGGIGPVSEGADPSPVPPPVPEPPAPPVPEDPRRPARPAGAAGAARGSAGAT